MRRPSIIHYQRRPRPANFSLEAIYQDVRARLRNDLDIAVRIAPCFSNGIVPRLRIMLDAMRYRRESMHITGDIHFATLLRQRNRTILTILDCGDLLKRDDWRSWLLKLLWFKLPVRKAAHIITISQTSKQDIVALTKCPAERISVIGVAVSESFRPARKEFDSQNPCILQVGTKPNKNVANLVAALSGIKCKLVIVGRLSEPELEALRASKLDYKNLVDLSHEEIVREYEKCDILAFASIYEGFGMPIIEAQRVGRAVLTSNCSSMPEVGGEGACFVDPLCVSSIRDGFQRIIQDEEYRETLIAAGFENAKRFDPDVIAHQYLRVYHSTFGSDSK